MGGHDREWDLYLDPILFAIRTSVQASTKHTPFFLMYGREAKLPLEMEKADAIVDIEQLPEVDQRIEQMSKVKDEVFPAVKANIIKAQAKQKEQYRKRRGLVKQHIEVGDTVMRLNMLKRTKKGHKAEDTWVGTYKVLEVTEHGCCRLHCLTTNTTLTRKVNLAQLKLYQCQEQPVDQTAHLATSEPTDHSTHLADTESANQTSPLADSVPPNQPTPLADKGTLFQPTHSADSESSNQPTPPVCSGLPDELTTSTSTESSNHPNHPAHSGPCSKPTPLFRSGFPSQPTLLTASHSLNQENHLPDSGSQGQPISHADIDSTSSRQVDQKLSDDELLILEEELFNQDLFRLVQYESSIYHDDVINNDSNLDVSIDYATCSIHNIPQK